MPLKVKAGTKIESNRLGLISIINNYKLVKKCLEKDKMLKKWQRKPQKKVSMVNVSKTKWHHHNRTAYKNIRPSIPIIN